MRDRDRERDDEIRTLHRRLDAALDAAKRQDVPFYPSPAAASFRVYNAGHIPTSLPGVFATHRVKVSGAESTGAPVTVTAYPGTVYLFVIGTKVPVVGDVLVGRLLDGRWVAERSAGARGSGPPCTGTRPTRTFNVTGCNGFGVPGAPVVVTDAFGTTTTQTANGAGHTTFTFAASGAYTWTVAVTRYVTATGSFTIAANCLPGTANVNVGLTPASGYSCFCSCSTPVANTLYGTDPCFGAITLTAGTGLGGGTWTGSVSGTIAGCTDGPVSLNYTLGYVNLSHTCHLLIDGTWDYSYIESGFPDPPTTRCVEQGPFSSSGVSPIGPVACDSTPVITCSLVSAPSGSVYAICPNTGLTWTFTE